jgi:hypothetical protein
MAAIPWWAYLGSGIIISAVSKWVEAKSEPGDFALFFWIGILFIVVGVGKVIVKYLFNKEKKQPQPGHRQHPAYQANHRAAGQHSSQHQAHPNAQHQNPQHPSQQQSQHPAQQGQVQHHISAAHQQPAQHPSIISCPICGTRHYDYAIYCMKCGTKMKR